MFFSTIFSGVTTGITFPDIDPVLIGWSFEWGELAIRWYALSYAAGILCGWYYLGTLNKKKSTPISDKAYDDFIIWAIFGILLGGRLGYVFFYNADYYFSHPSEILKVWQGGMSFHGGLIGAAISMYLMCKWYKLQFLAVIDLVACIAPIGLFFGRIANFINGELYGRFVESEIPWAVIFTGDKYARHPSQIYEALLEGLLLFIILNILVHKTKILQKSGALSGVFLLGYAIFRSIVELYREPDVHLGFIIGDFTMGQLLSFPMIILGGYLIFRKQKINNKNKEKIKKK